MAFSSATPASFSAAGRDPPGRPEPVPVRPDKRKVMIACAISGSVHTPSMSPDLPVAPEHVVRQAVEAARAGASIIHLHARNPADGRPASDPALFERFAPKIASQTDAILCIATSGGESATLEQRIAYPLRAKPELCSLNMGSMNFSFHKAGLGILNWKHPWERPYVEGSENLVVGNTFAEIRDVLARLGEAEGVRFEFECYDVGHLYSLAHFVDEGLVKEPLFVQCAFGVLGGLNPDPENLFYMRSAADRLFGRGAYEFSVLGTGRHQTSLVTMGAIMGGHVRVGLADSLFLGRDQQAPSCAAQVLKVRRILDELSLEVATPAEARAILQTRGANRAASRV